MEGLKAAFEVAKQVIAMSTGIIALTITFLEKILQPTGTAPRVVPRPLALGWFAFGIATLAAVMTLMAVTGSLNALDRQSKGLALDASQAKAVTQLAHGANVRIPSVVMLLAFAVGTALTIATGLHH